MKRFPLWTLDQYSVFPSYQSSFSPDLKLDLGSETRLKAEVQCEVLKSLTRHGRDFIFTPKTNAKGSGTVRSKLRLLLNRSPKF